MSRSFKKHPCDKIKSRFCQKMASRRCRRNKLYLNDGGYYKRTYPMWDVIDYVLRTTFKEYMDHRADTYDKDNIETVEKEIHRLEYLPSSKGVRIKKYVGTVDGRPTYEELGPYRKDLYVETEEHKIVHDITYKNSSEVDKEKNYCTWKKDMLRK